MRRPRSGVAAANPSGENDGLGQPCIHQLLGVFADRDAVGGHATALQDALRARGYPSEVFAGEVVGTPSTNVLPLKALERHVAADRTVLVYQASAFSPVADLVASRSEPLVVNYHNITPSAFFTPWEPTVGAELAAARRQLRALARRATLAVSDSAYNDHDLAMMGYEHRVVVPVLIDTARLDTRGPSPWPARPGARWLFVGRLAPNKAQHDVIKAFAFYRRVFDPHAVLALPGRSSSHRYQHALDDFVGALGLDPHVLRPGSVPDEELGGYYRNADVFVCLSEHEGFCNTVIEAMAARIPVVAYGVSALPETIRDAGILLEVKSPSVVATAVHRVLSDERLRQALAANASARLGQLRLASSSTKLVDALEQVAIETATRVTCAG